MSSQNSYKNMVIQIRNGQNSRKPEIYTNSSNLSLNILKVLKEQGYIRGYQFFGKKTKILLKYTAQRPAITKLEIVYKKNISLKNLKKISAYKGLGTFILSTPKGILSNYDCIKNNTSGFLLLKLL